MNARGWIEHLGLVAHPEGGFYREVYRSAETFAGAHLPDRFGGNRSFSTSIYYLLQHGDFSAFHRIASDEIWHFYAGGSLDIHLVEGDRCETVVVGMDPQHNAYPQVVIPHGRWFAAEPSHGTEFALVGCTVSPGFDFHDFELGSPAQVFSEIPHPPQKFLRYFRASAR